LPELPEVETVRRVLGERLKGRRLVGFRIGRPTFYRAPSAKMLQALVGRSLEQVNRRGKYLLLEFSGGRRLVLHLGMSGRLVLESRLKKPEGRHRRLELRMDSETLVFHDARRFGRAGAPLPEFGPEPLTEDLNPPYLKSVLRGKKAKIKAALLDQAVVAGLGNIYATEALFAAGIRPARYARGLTQDEIARLCSSIKEVLGQAVSLGGSTLGDEAYLDPLGRAGSAQKNLKIYGRKIGACGHPLKQTPGAIGGRRALYCPVCQK
jgi:formamidopyrimidine-DNA glycosylase